jgi:AcrR family transcriptional regulator
VRPGNAFIVQKGLPPVATTKTRRLGRPPASVSVETRQRIMKAGEKCFGLYGYDKTTNKDIADEAGLTTGALYHYFESKQDLYIAVFLDAGERVLTGFQEAAATASTAIGKLAAILDRAVELNMADEHIARFVSTAAIEIDRHEEFTPALGNNLNDNDLAAFWAQIIKDGVDSGEFAPDTDIEGVVSMLIAATSGMAQFAALVGDAKVHQRAIEAFKQLLQGQLLRPGTARNGFRRRKAG